MIQYIDRTWIKKNLKFFLSVFAALNSFYFSLTAQNFSIVGNGTTGNTTNTFPAPFGNINWGAKHQFFITAGELTAAGIPANVTINSIGFNVLVDNGSIIHNNFVIKVYSTNSIDPLISSYITNDLVSSNSPINYNPVVGWNQIPINSFFWNGVSNLVVETCFNNGFSSTNASTQWTTNLSGATIKTRRNHSNTFDLCSSVTGSLTTTFIRPNIRFGWTCFPGTVNLAQTICSGSQPAPLTVTGSSGAIQWQFSTNGTTWTNISGATSTTLSSAQMGALTGNRFYRVINTGSCTTAVSSNSVLITVNSVSAGIIVNSQTICSGSMPNTLVSQISSSGSGLLSYQWQSALSGSQMMNITGATLETYQSPPLIQTTHFRRITTSSLNGNNCTATSDFVSITVNYVSGGSISGNQTICKGDTPIVINSQTSATTAGTLTNQWQSSLDGTDWFDIQGVFSVSYQPPPLNSATSYRRVAHSLLNGLTCTTNSNEVTIIVNQVNSGLIGSDQTICEGETPELISALTQSTGLGALSYQWMISEDNNNWVNISSATNPNFQPSLLNATTYYIRNTLSQLNSVVCAHQSNPIQITVIPSFQTINVSSIGPYLFNNQFYFDSGTYNVNLIDQNGCEIEYTINLTIHGLNTPENEQQQITIFPNPSTSGIFYLNKPTDLKCENLKVNNSAGVMVSEIRDFDSVVDISKLNSGYYFLHLDCVGYRYVLKLQKL